MVTLQEQFEKDFPDKNIKIISAYAKYKNSNFTDWSLDLREYAELTKFSLEENKLTQINLSNNNNLRVLYLSWNNLTSIEFLNVLPNPEKLEWLEICDNQIQFSDIKIFSNFANLKYLRIGTTKYGLEERKQNYFYGSLKVFQNLTKLEALCIEATDVNEGLEYLPKSLATKSKEEREKEEENKYAIECSPHETNAKCKVIQDQLKPFNYDIEAWQLAHPEKMLIARPEYFINLDGKEKWINSLKNKLEESKKELSETDREKIKKIARLESKIQELEKAKQTISQQTQTDLTMEQINKSEKQQKEIQELKEKIKQLEVKNK